MAMSEKVKTNLATHFPLQDQRLMALLAHVFEGKMLTDFSPLLSIDHRSSFPHPLCVNDLLNPQVPEAMAGNGITTAQDVDDATYQVRRLLFFRFAHFDSFVFVCFRLFVLCASSFTGYSELSRPASPFPSPFLPLCTLDC